MGLVCHEPGPHTLLEQARPFCKARLMWMTGIGDHDRFGQVAVALDLRRPVEGGRVPRLWSAGLEDEVSSLEGTCDRATRCGAPASLPVNEDERRVCFGAPSAVHGPNRNIYTCGRLGSATRALASPGREKDDMAPVELVGAR